MGHCFNQSTNLGDCYYTIKVPIFGNCSMQSTFSGHCNRFKHPLKGTPSRESALILPNFWALFTVLANGIPDYFFSFHVSKVFCFCLTLAFYFVHPWLFVIFLCPMSRLVPLADHPPPLHPRPQWLLLRPCLCRSLLCNGYCEPAVLCSELAEF